MAERSRQIEEGFLGTQVSTFGGGRRHVHVRWDLTEEVGGYHQKGQRSELIPGLTPSIIRQFLDFETQTEAVLKMRDALRG